MPRLFSCLVGGQLIAFVATAVVGFLRLDPKADRHVLLGVLSLLFACFSQTIVFTYFTVTGKMIGQAMHIGGLGTEPLDEVKRLKRNATRWLALAFVGVVAITMTGAQLWRRGGAHGVHVIAAAIGLTVQAVAWYFEFDLIVRNGRLYDRVFRAYARRRSGAGIGPDQSPGVHEVS